MTELNERQKLYSELRGRLLENQLSNSENFDKAILSLSSAGLGISLTFIRTFVDVSCPSWLVILKISWVLFVLAIISTLFSFLTSQKGIDTQLSNAEKYYLEGKEDYFNKKNIFAELTNILNVLSALLFVFAVVVTVFFVSFSVKDGGNLMSGQKNTKNELIVEGSRTPGMQKVPLKPEKRGAPVPPMAPVQQPPKAGNSEGGKVTTKK